MPGLGFQIPFIHVIRIRDIREHTMDIHPQPVITKDNVEIQVDGIMWVRPTIDEESIKRTFYNIDDWKRAIIQLAMTNLRQEFGDLTLDESLVARTTIATSILPPLSKANGSFFDTILAFPTSERTRQCERTWYFQKTKSHRVSAGPRRRAVSPSACDALQTPVQSCRSRPRVLACSAERYSISPRQEKINICSTG
jgi:hypothetical protein